MIDWPAPESFDDRTDSQVAINSRHRGADGFGAGT
jgi:hypothetical protein